MGLKELTNWPKAPVANEFCQMIMTIFGLSWSQLRFFNQLIFEISPKVAFFRPGNKQKKLLIIFVEILTTVKKRY